MTIPPKHNITAKEADKSYDKLLPIPKGWRRLRQNAIIRFGDKMQSKFGAPYKWYFPKGIWGDRVRYGRFIRKIKSTKKQ